MCDFLVLNDVWPSEDINSTQYCIQELLEILKAGQLVRVAVKHLTKRGKWYLQPKTTRRRQVTYESAK